MNTTGSTVNDAAPPQTLAREACETLLLLVVAGLTLAGYVGIALALVGAVG